MPQAPEKPWLLNDRNLLAGVGAAAIYWGIRYRAETAIALGAGIATLLLLLWLYARFVRRRLVARRTFHERAFEDQPVEVSIEVGNLAALPVPLARIEDTFPADRMSGKRALVYPTLPGRTVFETRYIGACDGRRGEYQVGPLRLVTADPFGFFEHVETFEDLAPLVVYPRTFDVGNPLRRGAGSRFDAASALAALAGASLEFLGVREWRPGDEVRRICWPQTARTGELHVKEFEDATASDVAIFVDLFALSRKGLGRISTVEYSVKIAASLVRYYVRAGHRVALFAEQKDRSLHVPMGRGDVQAALLLQRLTIARPDGEVPFDRVVARAAASLDRGTLAYIIYSRLDVDVGTYIDSLTILRAKGVRVVATLIDDGTFMGIFEGHAGRDPAATSEAVAAFLAEGVPCYVVSAKDDLAARFQLPLLPDARALGGWGR